MVMSGSYDNREALLLNENCDPEGHRHDQFSGP
ncbi:MAG: hypothetical protein QOE70_5121 [Chthoniobacter sp.]|jgi:hypothetical protein|nr:hypothetical protein [Chthoniobacter sp.]